MRSLKLAIFASSILVALATGANATTAGNLTINQVSATCGPLAAVKKVNRPAFISGFSGGGDNYFDVTTYLNDAQSGSSTNYFFIYYFDVTAHTYSISAPGFPNLPGQISGTFTGSIGATSFTTYSVNVTLDCGTTMVGETSYIGN